MDGEVLRLADNVLGGPPADTAALARVRARALDLVSKGLPNEALEALDLYDRDLLGGRLRLLAELRRCVLEVAVDRGPTVETARSASADPRTEAMAGRVALRSVMDPARAARAGVVVASRVVQVQIRAAPPRAALEDLEHGLIAAIALLGRAGDEALADPSPTPAAAVVPEAELEAAARRVFPPGGEDPVSSVAPPPSSPPPVDGHCGLTFQTWWYGKSWDARRGADTVGPHRFRGKTLVEDTTTFVGFYEGLRWQAPGVVMELFGPYAASVRTKDQRTLVLPLPMIGILDATDAKGGVPPECFETDPLPEGFWPMDHALFRSADWYWIGGDWDPKGSAPPPVVRTETRLTSPSTGRGLIEVELADNGEVRRVADQEIVPVFLVDQFRGMLAGGDAVGLAPEGVDSDLGELASDDDASEASDDASEASDEASEASDDGELSGGDAGDDDDSASTRSSATTEFFDFERATDIRAGGTDIAGYSDIFVEDA